MPRSRSPDRTRTATRRGSPHAAAIRRLFAGATLAALAGLAAPGAAQPGASATIQAAAPRAARADELAQRGNRLFDEGRLEDALGEYREAWALKQSYDLAANLGLVESELGLNVDAAEHLAWSIRHFPFSATRAQRAAVQGFLAGARAQAGALAIEAGVDGAEIRVDGRIVGWAPLDDEVFVEPGARVVEATAPGFQPAQVTVDAEAGKASKVALVLAPAPPPPPPPPPAAPAAAPEAQPPRDDRLLRLGAVGLLTATVVSILALKRRDASPRHDGGRSAGARRRGRLRRWLRAETRLAASATARRLRARVKHPRSLLPPALDGAFASEDLAPARAALRAVLVAVPHAEALGEALGRLPASFPAPRRERVRRAKLVERLRRDVSTAEDALRVLVDLERHVERRGDAPRLAGELEGHLWDWCWRSRAMENLLARERAVLALDEAAGGLLPEERALLVEAVDPMRTSLGWVRRVAAGVWDEPLPSRARLLREARREMAAVAWSIDLVEDVADRVSERLSPRASPLVDEGPAAVVRAVRRSIVRARDASLGRRRLWRDAHGAARALWRALQEEAGHLQRAVTETDVYEDPRLPPPDEPRTDPDLDTRAS